mmetsp:Transcript_17619/g.43350  ORF Transcript_17619/g.43350 Transcript_17619/m.43350 type:complete len:99 (-) Transcript_17619:836-1132(-)
MRNDSPLKMCCLPWYLWQEVSQGYIRTRRTPTIALVSQWSTRMTRSLSPSGFRNIFLTDRLESLALTQSLFPHTTGDAEKRLLLKIRQRFNLQHPAPA